MLRVAALDTFLTLENLFWASISYMGDDSPSWKNLKAILWAIGAAAELGISDLLKEWALSSAKIAANPAVAGGGEVVGIQGWPAGSFRLKLKSPAWEPIT